MAEDSPRFDPLYSQHAIERCAWSVMFAQAVPEKLYLSFSAQARSEANRRGFQAVESQGFTFNAETGEMSTKPPPGAPSIFVSPDGAWQFSLQPNAISFTSTQYVRWDPFFNQVVEWPLKIAEKFIEVVSVGALKLEYWDRFIWSGTWQDFDPWEVLRSDTGLVAPTAIKNGGPWHSHVGWFEPTKGAARRLVNVNIDAADLTRPNVFGQQPNIGIYTMLQDSFALAGEERIEVGTEGVIERSRAMHTDLKGWLCEIISDDMQSRISLVRGKT